MSIGTSLGMASDARKWESSDKIADNSTFVGIEIELENLAEYGGHWQHSIQESGLWKVVRDGSLRNAGLEFIMSAADGSPVKGGDIIRALAVFKRSMAKYMRNYPEPVCSCRTSLHVHMDVRDLELHELKKLILLYAVFEDIFFAWADPTRRDNNYCRSMGLNSDISERMAGILAIPDGDGGAHLANHLAAGNKYDAMNLLSVRQRGSLEFRLMRGTYDIDVMLKWVNILLAMKLASRDANIIIDSFPEDMSQRGIPNLVNLVFGEWGEELNAHATDIDILRGVRKAQDLLLVAPSEELEHQFANHSPKTSSHLKAFQAKLQEV